MMLIVGKLLTLTITVQCKDQVVLVANYIKAIKITVDGPRLPRSNHRGKRRISFVFNVGPKRVRRRPNNRVVQLQKRKTNSYSFNIELTENHLLSIIDL